MSTVDQPAMRGALVPSSQRPIDLDPYEKISKLALPRWRGATRFGWIMLLLFFVGFGGFATFAPLASSVKAMGTVRVDREPRIVQHPNGGLVERLLVREGQRVQAGETLLILDETRGAAELEVLRKRYDAGLITQARLEAERDGLQEIIFPDEILDRLDDPVLMEMVASEQDLLVSRRSAREGEIGLIREVIAQTRTNITASQERLALLDEEIRLVREELEIVQGLYERGQERLSRVRNLQRTIASTQGRRAGLVGTIAQHRQRISEMELRILQSERDLQTQILGQLDGIKRMLRETGEQLPVSQQLVEQLELKAPVSGTIVRLGLNTDGAVIASGQVLMEIVPDDEELVVVATINPRDIDALNKGVSNVTVRLTAFSQRFTHPVEGDLLYVSPDVIKGDGGRSGYRAEIRLRKESLDAILMDQQLVAGMPAMAMIGVGERTLLTYLLDPLLRSFDAALREP
jgi:HlyD family type I secretion membrane fusion protein